MSGWVKGEGMGEVRGKRDESSSCEADGNGAIFGVAGLVDGWRFGGTREWES